MLYITYNTDMSRVFQNLETFEINYLRNPKSLYVTVQLTTTYIAFHKTKVAGCGTFYELQADGTVSASLLTRKCRDISSC